MSGYNNGFGNGAFAGFAAARAANQVAAEIEADARSAVAEWKSVSNDLQGRLAEETKRKLFTEAQLEGASELVRQLRAELTRVAPNSPLLKREVQDRIQKDAMAAVLEQHGYHYDTEANKVTKL